MKQDNGHLYDLSLPLQRQLKLTARVALAISLFATLCLMLTLYLLFSGQQQDDYLRIIQSLTRSQDQLVTAMLLGGAFIILIAGLFTWFIMLFSSARVAGPLYRFCRNIEMQIADGPARPIQLRKGDYLQQLSDKLSATVDRLQLHHADQLAVIGQIEKRLAREQGQADDDTVMRDLLQQLKQVSGRDRV